MAGHPHRVYTEPFAGGLNVLLNKRPAGREVAGDLNAGLINFWAVLRCRPGWLLDEVATLDYSRLNFGAALSWLSAPSGLLRAAGFLARNRFSRGGLGETFAWSDRLRGGRPGDANAWDTIRAELPAIAERVRDVEFRCCDALDLIRSCDGPDTLHYCDPPYLHETRTVRDAYAHEMTAARHAGLLAALNACRGAVLLSGYRSPLYDRELAGWTRHEFDLPNHSGQGRTKQRRVECVWVRPATP